MAQSPGSPDYFEGLNSPASELYKSPSQVTQPPSAPASPSPYRPLIGLIRTQSEISSQGEILGLPSDSHLETPQTHQFVTYHSPISNSSSNSANTFAITFVDNETETLQSRRGRPPNPEKQKKPEQSNRSVGRPADPTRHRPYDGPRGLIDAPSTVPRIQVSLQTSATGPIRQGVLSDWGLLPSTDASAQKPVPALVLAPPTGPRIEYVIPEADPNQRLEPDDADIEDPFQLMGEGQGIED
ncbi:hypothetical protein B0H19DRAFT_1145456, partial [Mycena capillaripes]